MNYNGEIRITKCQCCHVELNTTFIESETAYDEYMGVCPKCQLLYTIKQGDDWSSVELTKESKKLLDKKLRWKNIKKNLKIGNKLNTNFFQKYFNIYADSTAWGYTFGNGCQAITTYSKYTKDRKLNNLLVAEYDNQKGLKIYTNNIKKLFFQDALVSE